MTQENHRTPCDLVGRGALTPPRTVAHRPLAPLVRGKTLPSGERCRRKATERGEVLDFCEAKRLRGSR